MQNFRNSFIYVFLFFILVTTTACSQEHSMAGKYLETEITIPGAYSTIELNSNGTGIWQTDIDGVHIRWKTRGEQIWIYLEAGATISGRITDKGFDLNLAGLDKLEFKKQ